MKEHMHYGTVTEAIEDFRKQGYTMDLNLKENCLVCQGNKFDVDDFEIVMMYRYEGASDPADESAVYAIESRTGLKGILVTAYGMYSETISSRMLHKLRLRTGEDMDAGV